MATTEKEVMVRELTVMTCPSASCNNFTGMPTPFAEVMPFHCPR